LTWPFSSADFMALSSIGGAAVAVAVAALNTRMAIPGVIAASLSHRPALRAERFLVQFTHTRHVRNHGALQWHLPGSSTACSSPIHAARGRAISSTCASPGASGRHWPSQLSQRCCTVCFRSSFRQRPATEFARFMRVLPAVSPAAPPRQRRGAPCARKRTAADSRRPSGSRPDSTPPSRRGCSAPAAGR